MMATDACSLPSNFHRIHLFPESSLWMEVIWHPQLMDMVPETFQKVMLFWKYPFLAFDRNFVHYTALL